MQALYAPGARIVVRDCEWIVCRADPSDDGGYIPTVDGLSELVSGKSARFLTKLEEAGEAVCVLDPVDTRFEQDLSPGFVRSRLFIETQLRQITPADEKIHLGHKAAMNPVPYQLDLALQALKQNHQRILIADPAGLGKTLEASILMTELMHRGKRILVLTLKSMMTPSLYRPAYPTGFCRSAAGAKQYPGQPQRSVYRLRPPPGPRSYSAGTAYNLPRAVPCYAPVQSRHLWYDQTGRIVFTPSKGLVGVALPRKACNSDLSEGTYYTVHTGEQHPSPAGRWVGEENYRVAWKSFQQYMKSNEAM